MGIVLKIGTNLVKIIRTTAWSKHHSREFLRRGQGVSIWKLRAK
jgi:hypothetical protein